MGADNVDQVGQEHGDRAEQVDGAEPRRWLLPAEQVRRLAMAQMARERAEYEAAQLAREAGLDHRPQSARGRTSRVSVRMGSDELAALEGRAAVLGIAPSTLARNLIRVGLRVEYAPELPEAVRRLDAAVAELRALVTG